MLAYVLGALVWSAIALTVTSWLGLLCQRIQGLALARLFNTELRRRGLIGNVVRT